MPFLVNRDVKTHYTVEGSGFPLLLAHQGTDSKDYWYRNNYVERLKKHFLLIIPDARGHGESDKLYNTDDYHPKHVVEDFCALLNLLNVDRCHFWGYSLGGYSGLFFAHAYPERVSSLIVGGAFPQAIHSNFTAKLGEGFLVGIEQGPDALIDYFKSWWGGLPESLEQRYRNLDYKAILAGIRLNLNRPDLTNELPRMKTPTLFYAGDLDDAPNKYAPLAAEMMPNGEFVSFAGFTHGTVSGEVDLVLSQVLPFLKKHS